MILERNISIATLLLDYGLSLKKLVSLRMKHVHFENNTLSIPEPVRPKYHSNDPLFVAFDFTRGAYHWSYEDDASKFLTEISVQKMIRLEVKRANLRKGISAQHFRNTFILRRIQNNNTSEQIMQQIGFKSHLP